MKNSTTIPMTHSGSKYKTSRLKKVYKQTFNEFKKRQIGYSTIAIIGQSCLGSAAAMVILMGEIDIAIKMILLFFVTILCMAFNASVLAQLKSITIFNLLILSIVFSTLVIVIHLV
ncbi:hypothetical protein [Allomuricauda sp. F6463D]|uniref:hypothetical protein n=1 Tax=Allomuricauda sp. F6463D TaxID=2926409 RepID=UPI001FF20C91|nr:hypothetical protein [Muricauda sp. F6463D]MCK0162143.1 hypothetical protein [Muricauda sp. F6463D]